MFCNHLAEEERAGCFNLTISLPVTTFFRLIFLSVYVQVAYIANNMDQDQTK